MRTSIRILLPLVIAIFLTSCALQRPQVWEPHERLGLGPVDTKQQPSSTNIIERLIPVRIDRAHPSAGNFDLYYFVRMPAKGKATKTVLFCAGGPGQIVQGPMSGVTFADFLTANGYNVVFFHQRGAGFSQIPASNQYDRFLKTSYAVEDIEEIRKDFLGEHGNWEAIIGWSYGTVVAQQYTHFYPRNVERLILIGPMSRDKFKNSADAFNEILKNIRSTDRDTLTIIYSLPEFADLSLEQKHLILDRVFGSIETKGIFDQTEEAFGSLEFVIDSYCELTTKNELKNYQLDNYSQEFFQQLRNLRMFGWRPKDKFSTDDQVRIGHRIKEEILYSHRMIDDCSAQKHDSRDSSKRAFYVISTYDGINMPFLREWLRNSKQHVVDALKKSGGEANNLRNVNQYIGKIGIRDSETIEPWDPAQYKHDQPTLILNGSADTVTAGGAAEYFFRDALTGDRTLIEFPGIGHALLSETISFQKNILSGTVRIDQLSMPAGETRQVLGTYRGRNLNENYQMELKTDDLETDLKLGGFGIVGKNQTGSLDVVALIENIGNQTVTVPRKWTLNSKLWPATVSFDPQTINPGAKKQVPGKIEAAWGNRVIRLEKPRDLEPSLDHLCAQVRSEPAPVGNEPQHLFEIWIQNNSIDPAASPVDGAARSWTVSTDRISSTFIIDPPDALNSQEVLNWQNTVKSPVLTGLSLQEEAKIDLRPGNKLLGCIQEQGEGKVSMVIYNPETAEAPGGPQKLTINNFINYIFTRTYQIDLPPIKSNQAVVIRPTNPTYTWRDTPVLNRPSNLDRDLELLGWNVVGENEVSMLLRNKGQKQLNIAATEWVYIDPNEDGVACQDTDRSQNCLIYSFLVMSPEAFISARDNKVLCIIKDNGAVISYLGRNALESGKQITDNCP